MHKRSDGETWPRRNPLHVLPPSSERVISDVHWSLFDLYSSGLHSSAMTIVPARVDVKFPIIPMPANGPGSTRSNCDQFSHHPTIAKEKGPCCHRSLKYSERKLSHPPGATHQNRLAHICLFEPVGNQEEIQRASKSTDRDFNRPRQIVGRSLAAKSDRTCGRDTGNSQ